MTGQLALATINKNYPNNNFREYRKKLYANYLAVGGSRFWRFPAFVFQLSKEILKDAGIEIFFVLAFWLIITKMSQGRDLIVSLFEPDGIYNQWRIFYTVLSAISLSLSMWIIPAFLFQLRDKKNKHIKDYTPVFTRHLFFAHRILPLVPFWVLAAALFNQKGTTALFFFLSLGQVILINWFNATVIRRSARYFVAGCFSLALIAAIVYFHTVYKQTYTDAKVALVAILYLTGFLLNFFFHEIDFEILKERDETHNRESGMLRRHKINTICFIVYLIIHLGLLAYLFSDRRFQLAPESIMLYIFSAYVFFIDLFFYFINVTHQRRIVAAVLLISVLVVYYTSKSININLSHYTLDTIRDSSVLNGSSRLTFEERYALLKAKIDSNKSDEPYPVILVSGEGGGSRAGMWLSQNLINFDYYTKGKFRDHIFSISTVSGSSVGVSTLVSFWESTPNTIDTSWLEFPMKVYSNNFVGSSVKGMLLTDMWKSIWPWGHFTKDRNSILQDEEAYYTQKAVRETLEGKELSPKTDIPDEERILSHDFMNFFYQRNGNSVQFKNFPLVLINSCRSNDGRRGIISPVKLTDDVFNDAIDIAGYLYEDSVCDYQKNWLCYGRKRNISLGQACNLSELFPIFSAPAYIDSLGSFVDGGYHENSGLKTTLDVYLQLKGELERDSMQGKYRIYILYFKNGGGKKELYKPVDSELPFALPIKALSSQPFEGSASYFEEKARFVEDTRANVEFYSIQLDNRLLKELSDSTATEVKKKRTVEEQILNDLRTEDGDSTLKFPLARWLSKSVIKRMRLATFPIKVNPQRDDDRMVTLLEKINAMHNIEAASLSPFRKWSPNADRLIKKTKVKIIESKAILQVAK